ncbi:MAG TPA: hypothetical protein VHV31_14125 [Nitrolancea sp.]|nr:hypothetical protein [Nitrolancea sp.]
MSMLKAISSETKLARQEIRQGRFERSMALVTAFAAIVSGFEAYLQHQRGAFKDPFMWTPVALTPPTLVVAAATVVKPRSTRRLLQLISLAWLADGLVGTALHIRGIGRLPGGFKLGQYNVVIGPPIFAPLLTAMVGVLGFCGSVLRPEVAHPRLAALRPTPKKLRSSDFGTGISRARFQQVMALTTAAFGALAGGEAYFEHLRGSFNQRWMWTPVWLTPPTVVAAVAAMQSEKVAGKVLPALSVAAFADGMIGFVLHLRGIKRMPGHFTNLRFNVVIGPPLFAPLLLCSVGLLGLIASLLKGKAD